MPNSFTPQQIEQFLQEFFDVVGARQYIGARYVPIFGRKGEDTVEWDAGAPYEPLTVVMHLGVSYVSRQYVPTGTPITDTDFWVETYRFNAQVEQYRQEVLGFQGQIDQVRADMESDYVPFPDPDTFPKYGLLGQVLTTLSNGSTKWEDPVTVDAEIAGPLIDDWLDAHPEATTTVQDGSVTDAKLAANGIISRAMQFMTTTSFNAFTGDYSSCDNAPLNTIFRFATRGGTYQIPNSPSAELGTLITIGRSGQLLAQYWIDSSANGKTYMRVQNNVEGSNVWLDWFVIGSYIPDNSVTDAKLAQDGIISRAMQFLQTTSFNYFTNTYSSCDNAPLNSIFRFATRQGTNQIPNSPTSELGTLITIGFSGQLLAQYWIESKANGKTYMRVQNNVEGSNVWLDWFVIGAEQPITYVIDKNGSNNSLLEGMLYCIANGITDIRVKPGTYDMVAEYQAKYGNDWDTQLGTYSGIPLGNDMRIVFDPGAKVVFNYTGGLSNIHINLSLFNTVASDCYLEGLDLECSNLRYGIHDDCGNSTTPYTHTFKNCKIKKTDDNTDWTSAYAIAGGTGAYSRVDIDGGMFMCQNTAASQQTDTIYYHSNAAHTGTDADIYIHGIYCYGPRGTVHSGGQQQQDGSIANMYVYDCRFNLAPSENDSTAMKLYAWNNEIQTD